MGFIVIEEVGGTHVFVRSEAIKALEVHTAWSDDNAGEEVTYVALASGYFYVTPWTPQDLIDLITLEETGEEL
jgi:hypothetical protein